MHKIREAHTNYDIQIMTNNIIWPIPVAVQSKVCHLVAGIAGSIFAEDTDGRLLCLLCVV
jgi:hypothetical protein